jgi:hypothetical protein
MCLLSGLMLTRQASGTLPVADDSLSPSGPPRNNARCVALESPSPSRAWLRSRFCSMLSVVEHDARRRSEYQRKPGRASRVVGCARSRLERLRRTELRWALRAGSWRTQPRHMQ